MKKVIAGSILLTVLTIQPVIGWFIFRLLEIPTDSGVIALVAFIWSMVALFQAAMYGTLVVNGYREMGVKSMFDL